MRTTISLEEASPRIGQWAMVWGRQVHFHKLGYGEPVILLHGNVSLGEEMLRSVSLQRGISWIAPDRPGYGFSEELPPDQLGPEALADWIENFANALGINQIVVAAHSLACGGALCLAARHPNRVRALLLISPFCRPTPHRWMLGLRAAVAPVLGPVVRHLLMPFILPLMRKHVLRSVSSDGSVPPSLADFPVAHAARSQALLTAAAELRQFNAGMRSVFARKRLTLPVQVYFGAKDQTSVPGWHLEWLKQHVIGGSYRVFPDVGHALHHEKLGLVTDAVRKLV
jgi:pimeloyl-ACP methyl ester carboxylesterase